MKPRLICLANSHKIGGCCFAGRMLRGSNVGAWVRPVGDREHGTLLPAEIAYENGRAPSVLDVVGVPLARRHSRLHQQENWTVYADQAWERVGTIEPTAANLERLLDPDADLWVNSHSSHRGVHDSVAEAELPDLTDSLRFIRPDTLELIIAHGDEWKCRAHFLYHGIEYNLAVTDPKYGRAGLGDASRRVSLEHAWITVSLGEIFHGFAYKLVAAIVEVP